MDQTCIEQTTHARTCIQDCQMGILHLDWNSDNVSYSYQHEFVCVFAVSIRIQMSCYNVHNSIQKIFFEKNKIKTGNFEPFCDVVNYPCVTEKRP